jgi:hypothetical protein
VVGWEQALGIKGKMIAKKNYAEKALMKKTLVFSFIFAPSSILCADQSELLVVKFDRTRLLCLCYASLLLCAFFSVEIITSSCSYCKLG